MRSDPELLRLFAEQHDEAALAEFVRRHVDGVYAAAHRLLAGDAQAAAEVTQDVFVKLAREARALAREESLQPWLNNATQGAAAKRQPTHEVVARVSPSAAIVAPPGLSEHVTTAAIAAAGGRISKVSIALVVAAGMAVLSLWWRPAGADDVSVTELSAPKRTAPTNVVLVPTRHVQAETADGLPAPVKTNVTFRHRYFTFARAVYSTPGAPGRPGPQAWKTDYPEADFQFSARFEKVTGLATRRDGEVISFTDPKLSLFPFVYVVEGGQMTLAGSEAKALRDYLLGGGFLMIDDFWGESEWRQVAHEMKKVFPDREPVDLSLTHPIFHCFYEIREKPQIPNPGFINPQQKPGVTWEREDAKEPHFRGFFDNSGRLMAILCHNTDLGDGWESRGDPYYEKEFGLKKAFPMGINIVVYALSH